MKIQIAVPIQFLTEIEVDDNLLDKEDVEYLKDNVWENMDRTYEDVEKKLIEKCVEFDNFIKCTKFATQEDNSRDTIYWIEGE